MGMVINDTVKMQWEDNRWIQTKGGKGKRPTFILACKEYNTENGVVPVFFNAFTAFVFEDEDGLWGFGDIKKFIKENYDQSFPEVYDEYREIGVNPDRELDEELLAELGLTEYAQDIKDRLEDLQPYGDEEEVSLKS